MPRKMKLTRELISEAEKWIKAGNFTTVVCQYLGIHQSTWYRWMAEGEKAKKGIKKEFYDRIKKAESHSEMRNVQLIQQAGNETWQAAAWYLERKFPDRWGKREKVDANLSHSGEVTNKSVDLSELTTEELREIANLNRDREGNSG